MPGAVQDAFVLGRRWSRPTLSAAVLLVALLRLTIDHCPCPAPAEQALHIRAAVAVLVAAWLAELWGAPWPKPVFAVVVAAPVLSLAAIQQSGLTLLLLVLMVAWVAYRGTARDGLVALALSLVVLAAGFLAGLAAGAGVVTSWISWAGGVALVWYLGRTLESRERLVGELRAAQADLSGQAAAAERRRIARDIHDLVAHSLSVTLLQLTGARHILGRDPARAAEALAEAERIGRQSLADLRRTVGLLRDTGEVERWRPPPHAVDITWLVDDFRRAGLGVELAVTGDPSLLFPAAGLGLYRIAQEALANVAKHAPGASARVELQVSDDGGATLRVRSSANPGSASNGTHIESGDGAGIGIAGMRERAALLGGALTGAGPDGEGWLVECSIPGAGTTSVTEVEAASG